MMTDTPALLLWSLILAPVLFLSWLLVSRVITPLFRAKPSLRLILQTHLTVSECQERLARTLGQEHWLYISNRELTGMVAGNQFRMRKSYDPFGIPVELLGVIQPAGESTRINGYFYPIYPTRMSSCLFTSMMLWPGFLVLLLISSQVVGFPPIPAIDLPRTIWFFVGLLIALAWIKGVDLWITRKRRATEESLVHALRKMLEA
ncbi:MAG: hypothetical protein WCF84_12555 [Anaerolineae bacterium]